jgi:DedD protein
MALLDKGLKQRIVGALVLVALAVIFVPMLLSRQDEQQAVRVDAPSMPDAPGMPEVVVDPVEVPVAQLLPDEPLPGDSVEAQSDNWASVEIEPETSAAPVAAVPPAKPTPAPTVVKVETAKQPVVVPQERLDANTLPVSWSVQLASLSNRENAEKLQQSLRAQGYNAYIRTAEGMNRVFVGPLIERAQADRVRDQLSRQQKLNGLVVRFQPERS